MILEWSFNYFLVQIVAGFLGAHAAALVSHEYRFGLIGHSLVGIAAGALGGFFLQRMVLTVVDSTGGVMPITGVEALTSQAAAGLVVGGIAMLAVGFVAFETAKASTDSEHHPAP